MIGSTGLAPSHSIVFIDIVLRGSVFKKKEVTMTAKKSIKNPAAGAPSRKVESMTMTIKEYYDLISGGKVVSETAFQRPLVSSWLSQEKVDAVYDSLLDLECGIGVIFMNRVTENKSSRYELLDGKQRTNCIRLMMTGIHKYHGVPIVDSPSFEKFLRLPLHFIVFDNLSLAESAEIFSRLNAGARMSALASVRGKIVNVLGDARFVKCVDNLHALKAGFDRANSIHPAGRGSSEEILIQALSARLGNRNYSGTTPVKVIGGDEREALAQLDSLLMDVTAWCYATNPKTDVDGEWRSAQGKTVLNVILGMDGGVPLNNLARFFRTSGKERSAFKSACAGSTASETSVSARFEIMALIKTGAFEGVEKPAQKGLTKGGKVSGVIEGGNAQLDAAAKAAKGAKEAAKEAAKAALNAAVESKKAQDIFDAAYGEGVISESDKKYVLDMCALQGGKHFKPYRDSGNCAMFEWVARNGNKKTFVLESFLAARG